MYRGVVYRGVVLEGGGEWCYASTACVWMIIITLVCGCGV